MHRGDSSIKRRRGHSGGRLLLFGSVLAGALLLIGCAGRPVPSESRLRAVSQDLEMVLNRASSLVSTGRLYRSDAQLMDWIIYAAAHQPEVRAAYHRWRAEIERVTQARSLPDPEFGFQMDVRTVVQMWMPALSQSIPGPGKLRFRGEAQGRSAEIAFESFRNTLLHTAARIRVAAIRLAELEEEEQLLHRQRVVLESLRGGQTGQIAVRSSTVPEFLLVDSQLERVESELRIIHYERRRVMAELKSARV